MSSRYNKILLITVSVAFATWFFTWFAFRQRPWGADLAVCVGYTILVSGLIYADENSRIFALKARRPLVLIALQHICFLIGAIALYHGVMYIEPVLEAADAPKMHLDTGVPVVAMIGLAYAEKWILDRDSDQGSGADDEDSFLDSSSAERKQD